MQISLSFGKYYILACFKTKKKINHLAVSENRKV